MCQALIPTLVANWHWGSAQTEWRVGSNKYIFYIYIFDFCNCSKPHKLHIFDKQLPSSLARAIRFETSNSFARNDTGVVIDNETHLSRTCKSTPLFSPLAVRVQAGCFAFPFYTPTKPLIRLYLKYKTGLIPKLKMMFIF